jgi:hypothetical protein
LEKTYENEEFFYREALFKPNRFKLDKGTELFIVNQFEYEHRLVDYLAFCSQMLVEQCTHKDDYLFQKIRVGHASPGGIELMMEHVLEPILKKKNGYAQWVIGLDYNKRIGNTKNKLINVALEWMGKIEIWLYKSEECYNQINIMHSKQYWMGWVKQHGHMDIDKKSIKNREQVHYIFTGSNNMSENGLVQNYEDAVGYRLHGGSMEHLRILKKNLKNWNRYMNSRNLEKLNIPENKMSATKKQQYVNRLPIKNRR